MKRSRSTWGPEPRTQWLRLVVVVASLGVSCTSSIKYNDVVVEQVVPGNGPPGETVSVEILGSFHLAVVTNLGGGQTDLGGVTATVGGVAVDDLVFVNDGRLTGLISASLPLGVHDVKVSLPDGRSGTLPGGYIVGDAPIDAGLDGGGCSVDCTAMIADDPFGDGTPFTYIAGFNGRVYFGPSADGSTAVRTMPDGSGAETVSFTLPKDTTANSSRNTSTPPYTSIGTTGCAVDTLACGPDNEDGRGLFAAGTLGGTEWLALGGGRTLGDLDYVYMVSAPEAPLAFRYVDLGDVLGPQVKGFSALHTFGDRLYLGFPATGGTRPYLLALVTAPPSPGLEASSGNDVFRMRPGNIPGFDVAGTAMIDAIIDFNARVYIANSGAWARSNIELPMGIGDWNGITPADAAFAAKTSVTTAKVTDIEPIDRAVPQMAVFGSRLYAARNTTDGPQLWMCDPAAAGDLMHCDGPDWSLIVANTEGDTQLSQFDNPANTSVTLLVATPTHLYVGFDNAASGIVVFRSSASVPMTAADFEGASGCSADTHPTSCDGIAGNGLGDASNTRIFFGIALTFGPESSVYVSTGSGASGVRIYRLW